MSALALAPAPKTALVDLDEMQDLQYMPASSMNPLQQLLAEAMRKAGIPLEARGSKAELQRRSGVHRNILDNLFARPRYVPAEKQRAALARALGIPRADIDTAAAQIKGLRVYTTEPVSEAGDVVRQLDQATQSFLLASDELSQDELDEVAAKIDELVDELRRRAKGGQSTNG